MSASICLMLSPSASTLQVENRKRTVTKPRIFIFIFEITKCVNSQGLVNGAGEVFGAQTGEEVWVYVWQQREQFDLVPEFDEFGIVQVMLGQSWRLILVEYLLNVRCQPCKVLKGKQKSTDLSFCRSSDNREELSEWLSSHWSLLCLEGQRG